MAIEPKAGVYTDFSGLARLKAAARADKAGSTQQVARQFETIFTQMMLKSMRAASLGQGALDSDQSRTYRDLSDQQMALTLSTRGRGLGIADMLVRQLRGNGTADPANSGASTALTATMRAFPLPARPLAPIPLNQAGGKSARAFPTLSALAVPTKVAGALPATYADSTLPDLPANWRPASPQDFVQTLFPYAEAAAKMLGVAPRALIAHAALETGWGKHMPKQIGGASSFNLFGIKAGGVWSGDRTSAPTVEVENGVAVHRRESFRAYSSPAASFMDYANLLAGNPRYAETLGRGDDVAGFARALQSAGYATDPRYAAKLTQVADSAPMRAALAAVVNPASMDTARMIAIAHTGMRNDG